MKYFLVAALFLGGIVNSLAQNRIGIETGVTAPLFTVGNSNDAFGYRHSAYMKPTISMSYLRKIDKHVYVGGALGLEAYDFYFSKTQDYKTDLQHFSSYFTITPMVDFGLGSRQYMHIFVSAAMGFLTSFNETTGVYGQGSYQTPDYSYNSSGNVRGFIFRPGLGLKQHFPISRYWHITLSESYSLLATDLTHIGEFGGIHPAYIMFKLGVMRKFHRPLHAQSAE
ncbi:MAG: hypothetical protein H7257_02340 [Taibaiella sp.]|nr:hypothetical protein [Taibaiella sp.]